MSKSFESSRAPEPVGAFPHAKRVGNLLFLSGIGPRVRGSREIPGVTLDAAGNILNYDIEAQCRQVFANVRAVLEASGARWEDRMPIATVFDGPVVDITDAIKAALGGSAVHAVTSVGAT